MKWLGQYIQDLPSRFRDDVYLESISTDTIASGAHLGLDSNNKIVKATDGGGDLTSIVAGAGLSGTSLTGPIPTLIVDFSEFATITPTNGDSLATLDSDGATEQLTSISRLATLFAGTGLTASSSVISVDAAQTGITSLGTLTGLTLDGAKSITPGDGAMIHVDTSDITDSNTSGSGTAAKYTHVNIEGPRLLATNSSVTTTNAATLYISSQVAAHTNQTITYPWALWVDNGNVRIDDKLYMGTSAVLADSSGTCTLQNIDAIDATTEATFESAIDTLSNLTTTGTIGTGVWQGTAIASAYLDADTAHLSTSRQLSHHVFVDNMGTTKQYIGLTEADAENTSTSNKFLPFPAITAGKLLKVALRSNKNLTGHTLTWRLESIGAANPNSATPDILGTQSGAGCNNTTMTTYDFTTGLDSGDGAETNAFDASDLVYLSIQSDTSFGANVIYYITCIWEWDLS